MSADTSRCAFLIAAPSSGAGKTTVTLGILRALARAGRSVQPFKCGPDYIDTQFHQVAAGCPSVNLDLFMSSPGAVASLFQARSAGAGVSVIEGAMGLFDGYDCSRGSAADIARVTGVPVILVVDAARTAYSVAAVITGVRAMLGSHPFAGVIFNRVGSPSHEVLLRRAAGSVGVPVIGALPRCDGLTVPSRHLGLSLGHLAGVGAIADRAADLVEAHLPSLLEPRFFSAPIPAVEPLRETPVRLRIAMARDEAFCFTYAENLRGHNILTFSPLRDTSLPADVDLLYLPGGYPELYAGELAANAPMLQAVRRFAASGGKILAECGGLLYLCRDIDGVPVAGLLPLSATMRGARLRLGYRRVVLPDGTEMRGHEFHYSSIVDPGALPSAARQFNAAGEPVATPLYHLGNIVAGYTHLYWAGSDILSLFRQ